MIASCAQATSLARRCEAALAFRTLIPVPGNPAFRPLSCAVTSKQSPGGLLPLRCPWPPYPIHHALDVPSPLRDADAGPPYHARIPRSALPPVRPHAPRPAACARALIRSGFTSVASWQSCVIWWMTYNRPVRRTRDSNTRRRRVSDGEWVSGESGPGDAHPVRFAGAKLPTHSSKRPRLSPTQVAAIASRLPSE